MRRGGRPGGSPSTLPALTLWDSRPPPQLLLPGEVRWGPGGGLSGGGRGTGAAPSLLAPLRRRSGRREEPVRVCAGERLASGLGGGSQRCREGVAGRPAWPALRPSGRRLASLPSVPSAAGAAGAQLRRPLQSAHVVNNCSRFWPSGPQPPLRARLRRLYSDQRKAQTSCRCLSPRTSSGPLDRLAPARRGPFSTRRGLVPVPTPLPAPGLELQNTSRAVGGRDTP